MNRRQAQRTLVELISKCEAAHIQLPEDPLEARAEAVEAIIHSQKDGKADLGDARDELQQKFGLELMWKQHMENEEAKRQRRRQARQKKGTNRIRDSKLATNLEFLPETSPQKDQVIQGTNSDGEHQPSAHNCKADISKGGVMTLSKRPAADQDAPMRQNVGMKVAKKVKSARESIFPDAPSATEEKQSRIDKKPPAEMGNIFGGDNSSESPDQEITSLLELEDLDEIEGKGSGMSSEGEFAL